MTDPFLGSKRRIYSSGRGFGRLNFQHDITAWSFSYGMTAGIPVNGGSGKTQSDIIDMERDSNAPHLLTR